MKFIFAFLLLATLSMVVNAIPHQLLKRTTVFSQCPPVKSGEAPPPLLSVILSPDPVAPGQPDSVAISGTLSRPVIDGDITAVGFIDLVAKTPIGDPATAPTDPKTPFSQVLNVDVPAKLPATYIILAGVGNPKTQEVIGCAFSVVGGSAESVDLDSYPIPLL
ncbi:13920_t:CDS:1 [Entrophospora sp. SA101]|nr:16059_t:CDS:1 [Entrophospora sp. SA101]CAJ0762503.1 13920_t:CDS:1 [Entrophospora sp. SA101]CAJ0844122.1 6012_t:CDS:1 [Entrophospora sp. SA101]CAJ0844509.1 11492_t:CDS:1 [Entrophospora sp. SA101]CAJ0908456.1 2279_t:CDS:1 [Entrophospora sp. SA101]